MPAVVVDSPIVIVSRKKRDGALCFAIRRPLTSVFSDSTFCRSALPLRFVIVVRRRIWTDDRPMPLDDCPVHSLRASAVTAAGEYFFQSHRGAEMSLSEIKVEALQAAG